MKTSTAFILVLISAGLFYTFIEPEYQNVQALRVEAANYQDILNNVSDLSTKRDELLVKYQAVPPAEVSDLSKVLPDHIDTVRLAMDFDSIAGRYGISIKQIQTVPDANAGSTSIIKSAAPAGYDSTTVSFSFVATYDNFRKFMHDIEQSLRIIDITSLSFKVNSSGLNEYQVSIKTYWLKQ